LLNPQWIVGFTDVVGCFNIDIYNNTIQNEIKLSFSIQQHKVNIKILYKLKKFFKCGIIIIKNDIECYYKVNNIKDLTINIIPFFRKYNLKTFTNIIFLKFAYVLHMLNNNIHMTEFGLNKIINIKNYIQKNTLRYSPC
jgi:hypothetical protein